MLVEQNFRFVAPLADRFYVMEHGKVVLTLGRSELDARQHELDRLLNV